MLYSGARHPGGRRCLASVPYDASTGAPIALSVDSDLGSLPCCDELTASDSASVGHAESLDGALQRASPPRQFTLVPAPYAPQSGPPSGQASADDVSDSGSDCWVVPEESSPELFLGRSAAPDAAPEISDGSGRAAMHWQHAALPPAGSLPPAETFLLTVQFKYGRQGEFTFQSRLGPGTFVVVTGDRGVDLGMVMEAVPLPHGYHGQGLVLPALRVAEDWEAEHWRGQLAAQEKAARTLCQEIMHHAGLNMRIVHAEYQFDMRKLTFHFTSKDIHPQFRCVLNECYSIWKCRIWFARYSRICQDIDNRRQLISCPQQSRQDGAQQTVSLIRQPVPEETVEPVRRVVYVVHRGSREDPCGLNTRAAPFDPAAAALCLADC
eukprot:TRINITY_DN8535_c1_g2_i1.p1 TRINITY_DN8535_c1_g2~~TRINITY_DN8535_c1_g2_i1.p1  ORF type:complete len:407 (+),score=106.93 TRINITY_DN8535_c1_g2_i1:83-1222(+)